MKRDPENKVAFAVDGVFAGWPANNGLWAWDREILAGCSSGEYILQPGHNIGDQVTNILLRSLDGGETWSVEKPVNYAAEKSTNQTLEHPIDFSNPDLAIRVIGDGYHGVDEKKGGFHVSNDRGKTWGGPYSFTGLESIHIPAGWEYTPRTDVLPVSGAECLFCLSARDPNQWGSDRVFCAKTQDGGMSFQFVSWVVPPADPYRAVMPNTVRIGPAGLVSAVRRRSPSDEVCWIDAYKSMDGGQTWSFCSKIGETGVSNGNPPALAASANGQLCCVYGNRSLRQMRARFSQNHGASWEPELILRDDFYAPDDEPDLGYPRLVWLPDGRLAAIYYWATRQIPQQHIAVTIFQPDL